MDKDIIHETYLKEQKAINRFKHDFCPMHVLLACACGDCPVKGNGCIGSNPGSALGIDHQTLRIDRANGNHYVFRPYKTSFGGEKRELLERFCEYFKLKMEVRDENTYCAEVEGRVYTVIISSTEESLRFRKGGNVLGTPWYGKDSPSKRFRDTYRK